MFLPCYHVHNLVSMFTPSFQRFNLDLMFLTSGRGSELHPLLCGVSDAYVIALVTAFEEVTNAVTPTVDAVLRGGQLLKDTNVPVIHYNCADARIEHLQFRFQEMPWNRILSDTSGIEEMSVLLGNRSLHYLHVKTSMFFYLFHVFTLSHVLILYSCLRHYFDVESWLLMLEL
jgi:hypothetical protein